MSETNAVKDESGVEQRSELQPVVMCDSAQPKLTVRLVSYPESNGKRN